MMRSEEVCREGSHEVCLPVEDGGTADEAAGTHQAKHRHMRDAWS